MTRRNTTIKDEFLETQEKIQETLVEEIKLRDRIIDLVKEYMGRDNFRNLIELNSDKIYKGGKDGKTTKNR